MTRVARAFLVWMLLIALPIQGWAASSMLPCGPSHARMVPASAAQAPAALPDRAADAVHDPAAHHGAHGHALAGPVDAAGPAAASAASSAHGAHDGALPSPDSGAVSCSACAACCIGLALPARFVLPAAPGPAHPLGVAPAAPVPSPPVDGLDRPPRAVLA